MLRTPARIGSLSHASTVSISMAFPPNRKRRSNVSSYKTRVPNCQEMASDAIRIPYYTNIDLKQQVILYRTILRLFEKRSGLSRRPSRAALAAGPGARPCCGRRCPRTLQLDGTRRRGKDKLRKTAGGHGRARCATLAAGRRRWRRRALTRQGTNK